MLRLLSPASRPGESAVEPQRETSDAREPNASEPLAELAALCREGDAGAQRTLLVAVGPAMLRVIRGVEDTLQDSMVALHLSLGGFRGECTTTHFACRIAVQTAMNARRRAGYRTRHTPNSPPEELAHLARDDRSPADLVAADRRRQGLRSLVAELPEPQAEVLALHAVLGYTIEETAAVTAAPINTVRSRLRNALAKLRLRVESDHALRETIEGGS
jgi:RNA polymerase sigma-70 factor (ECF subfamily)